jgi:hypothetical protein
VTALKTTVSRFVYLAQIFGSQYPTRVLSPTAHCRSNERIASLEAELQAQSKHSEEVLTTEKRRNDRELERLKTEAGSQRVASEDRLNRITAELSSVKVGTFSVPT